MDFVCPKCKNNLKNEQDKFICENCGESWEVKDGIPLFTQSRYWGEIPQAGMKEILDFAAKGSSEEVRNFVQNKYGDIFRFSYDSGRADWRFYLPVKNDWRVLDAGCGVGGMSFPFIKLVKEVVAFDSSIDRIKFINRRKELEKVSNFITFVGDVLSPPLPPGSFNLIILNGVLEWVGESELTKDNGKVQLQALKNCHDLLSPSGHLYVGIENRFSLIYLLGGRDHSGLRFVSFLPRFLANLYSKLARGKKYRNYLYGKDGYEKLLKESGFKNIKFLLPLPGYNFPKYIIPYDNLECLRYAICNLVSSNSWRKRLVKKFACFDWFLRIYRKLFFSFGIIAQK